MFLEKMVYAYETKNRRGEKITIQKTNSKSSKSFVEGKKAPLAQINIVSWEDRDSAEKNMKDLMNGIFVHCQRKLTVLTC